jgi:TRAP-type C4-dicarboxylate transport system permease small subunit
MPSRALALVSCSILFIMMLLTFVDVTGRYIFNSPLPALHEIISFMMPGLIFCILPLVCSKEEHVTIDLLDTFVPKRVKRVQAIFVNLISSGAMFFLAWRLAEKSAAHFEYGEVTDDLYLILWPFSLLIAVLSAIAAIALLSNTYSYIFNNCKSYEKLEQE